MPFLGFFGRYDKPGPGVRPEEEPQAGPLHFFRLLGRKLPKLVQVNLIFFLPTLAALVCTVLLFFYDTHLVMRLPDEAGGLQFETWRLFSYPRPGGPSGGVWLDIWGGFVAFLPLAALAPFTAGLTFVTRSFVRGEYAFVWSDFWRGVKENWKSFLLNGLLCYLFYVVLIISVFYYSHLSQSQPFYYIPLWICVMVIVLFVFAQLYLPMIFITFDMKFGQAYKNAFILAFAGWKRNFLLSAALAAAAFFLGFFVATANLLLLVPLCSLILFSFFSFLINYTVCPVIDRWLIKPYEKLQNQGPDDKK